MTTIYLSLSAQVAKSTFFMKCPVEEYYKIQIIKSAHPPCLQIELQSFLKFFYLTYNNSDFQYLLRQILFRSEENILYSIYFHDSTDSINSK